MYESIPKDLLDTLDKLFATQICTSFSTNVDFINGQTNVVTRFTGNNKEVRGLRNSKWKRQSDKQMVRDHRRYKPSKPLNALAPSWAPPSQPEPPAQPVFTPSPPVAQANRASVLGQREGCSPVLSSNAESVPVAEPVNKIQSSEVTAVLSASNSAEPMEVKSSVPLSASSSSSDTVTDSSLDEVVEHAKHMYPAPMSPLSIVNGICRCMFCDRVIENQDGCFLCVVCSAFDCGCDEIATERHKHSGYDKEQWLGEEQLIVFKRMCNVF